MSNKIPDYLKKNFDPETLSIPQLRSILKDHGVDAPQPNQPKRVFIKLFNNEIFDKREEILKKLNLTDEEPKRKRSGRPKKKSETKEADSVNSPQSDLPQALRGKSDSPAVKNKRVSFGGNEFQIKYDKAVADANRRSSIRSTTDAIKDLKNIPQDDKPLVQNAIKKLNEETQNSTVYKKSYNSDETGISQGSVKRARQQFTNEDKQDVEIKKENVEEPSTKKRRQSEKLNVANTSSGNIFQKFDDKKMEEPSSDSKIPKANVVYAEENYDEEKDEDYVYHSNSPSPSPSSDGEINDEEMADLEKESQEAESMNLNSNSIHNISYQEPPRPVSIPEPTERAENISFSEIKSKFEKPQYSQSFSYNPNQSFNKSTQFEKPKYSQSFSYNNGGSPSNYRKNSSFYRKSSSPYNTSFNDKPKINISYDMSPIQSNRPNNLYDDNLLNPNNRLHNNSHEIGNLYNSISDDDESNVVEIVNSGCSWRSFINASFGVISFVFTALVGLFIHWYVNTGGFVGYCKPNRCDGETFLSDLPETSIFKYNPFYHLLPKYIECPKNSICNSNHVIECRNRDDDKLQTRFIANIIPKEYLIFPLNEPVCDLDYEKKRNYDLLMKNTRSLMLISNQIIRKRFGELECKESYETIFGSDKEKPKRVTPRGISESELRETLKIKIGTKIRPERFKTLWNTMLEKSKKYSDPDNLKNLCKKEALKKKWKTTESKDDSYFCDILTKFRYIPDKVEIKMIKNSEGSYVPVTDSNGNETKLEDGDKEFTTREGLFKSLDKPIHSTKCQVKWFMDRYIRSNIYRAIKRVWKYVLGVVILVLLGVIGNLLWKRRNRRSNIVNSICEEVLWLLQEAECQNKEDPLHFPSPNISVAQLYDILLPAVIGPKDKNVPEGECIEIINDDGSTTHYWVFHHPKERALIWKRVYDQVRANSNVLESNALVKRESHRCWEWIGNPTLYNRRRSPNAKNKSSTYIPKGKNSRLSIGGVSNRSFSTSQPQQQFAGDISAITNSGPNANESYVSLLSNVDELKEGDSTIKGHINKLSIFNSRRQSQISEKNGRGEEEEEVEIKNEGDKSKDMNRSSLYPTL